MGITRQGREKRSRRSERRSRNKEGGIKNSQYIIKTKKSIPGEILVFILSVVVWAYVAIVVRVFLGAILNINSDEMRVLKSIIKVNNGDLREFMLVSVLWLLAFFTMLWIWRTYNYKRYGKLRRRSSPANTSKSDILELELVSEIMLYRLQNNKVVVLENSPIKDI